jgi:hypothetical protein
VAVGYIEHQKLGGSSRSIRWHFMHANRGRKEIEYTKQFFELLPGISEAGVPRRVMDAGWRKACDLKMSHREVWI